MRRAFITGLAAFVLGGCSTFEWPTNRDEMTAQEMSDRDCRQSRSTDPVARGEWVCENPRTGEAERQDRQPVYDPDGR
ncbi:hypothetical protein [Hyphobacterium sp.]|jgi:hypothetical protein|uniref:hypothetical protein n=1 Tax=Hyphobacterium sp. TaxID=2004662 RepID=UPI003BA88CDC